MPKQVRYGSLQILAHEDFAVVLIRHREIRESLPTVARVEIEEPILAGLPLRSYESTPEAIGCMNARQPRYPSRIGCIGLQQIGAVEPPRPRWQAR